MEGKTIGFRTICNSIVVIQLFRMVNGNQLQPAKQRQEERKAMESTEEHQPLEHKFDKPQATEQVNRR